jgi:hypothetical protein
MIWGSMIWRSIDASRIDDVAIGIEHRRIGSERTVLAAPGQNGIAADDGYRNPLKR